MAVLSIRADQAPASRDGIDWKNVARGVGALLGALALYVYKADRERITIVERTSQRLEVGAASQAASLDELKRLYQEKKTEDADFQKDVRKYITDQRDSRRGR